MAGVGKTSLAVWVAHTIASRYPDGQLFVDLHGFTHPGGIRPELKSVVTRVLRSLDPTDRPLPADWDELTARYRSAIADRRILLVLDNAANAEQVETLLPGTPGSLIPATSRRDLSPLAGAYSVRLEPPPTAMPPESGGVMFRWSAAWIRLPPTDVICEAEYRREGGRNPRAPRKGSSKSATVPRQPIRGAA